MTYKHVLFIFSFIFQLTHLNTIWSQGQTYEVNSIKSGLLHINGKGDDPAWNNAPTLTDFIYPWNEGSPPSMSFQALHDKEWIYGRYQVIDPKKILIYINKNEKPEILSSDRVEIFFRKDAKMYPYYGLELDPLGRIYDYQAHYHRDFNPAWTWPKGQLIVKASLDATGYNLEFAISKKSLKKLGLLHDHKIEAGVFRGECVQLENSTAEFKWISWVRPDSKTPDFHLPSSFGVLVLK